MEDLIFTKLSESGESDESERAGPSSVVSMVDHHSNESTASQLAMQELKEESYETTNRSKNLKIKHQKAKEIAYKQHFEAMQLLNDVFKRYMENIDASYHNKEEILRQRQDQIQNAYHKVSNLNSNSRHNMPLSCIIRHRESKTIELKFDPSMILYNTIDENSTFRQNINSTTLDADAIENFKFPKLKHIKKVINQLKSMNNDLKLDSALIRLKNNDNMHLQRVQDRQREKRRNNNNNNNNTRHGGAATVANSLMSTPIDYTYEDNTPNTLSDFDENVNLNFEATARSRRGAFSTEDSISGVKARKRVSIPGLSNFVKLMDDVNDNSKEIESKSDDAKEDDINRTNINESSNSRSRSRARKDTAYPRKANIRSRSANIHADVKNRFKSKMYRINTTNGQKIRNVDVDKVINGGNANKSKNMNGIKNNPTGSASAVGSMTAQKTGKTKSTSKSDECTIVTENLGSVSTLASRFEAISQKNKSDETSHEKSHARSGGSWC